MESDPLGSLVKTAIKLAPKLVRVHPIITVLCAIWEAVCFAEKIFNDDQSGE